MENTARLFEPTDRRYRELVMPLEILGELIFNTRIDETGVRIDAIEIVGMPRKARIQALAYDPMRNAVRLRLHSAEWPECAPDLNTPEMRLEIRRRSFIIQQTAAEVTP